MRRWWALAALLPVGAASAQETQPQPVCIRAATMPGFEGFGKAEPGVAPAIGKAVAVTLAIVDASPTAPAAHSPKPGTFLGSYKLTVTKAGVYRVAVSQGAWIDVVGPGGTAKAVVDLPGAACSGIAKIVGFDLAPGAWQLQISEAKGPNLTVMVAGD